MTQNEFQVDLKWSEEQHSQDWWTPYYDRAFPSLSSIQKISGPCAAQRAGIDKFVILDGGKKIAVDEKIRRTRPPTDIAIEFRHVPVDGSEPWPGWICKPNQYTDFVAFGFASFKIAFFLPFPTLQAAWWNHSHDWLSRFQIVIAPNPRDNPRYHSHSVAVPTEHLLGCILDAIRVRL
jgi:hypothetical protein